MNNQIFVVDHNKFRRFNYINSPSANFQLGQILINPKTNEIGVVIQTHSDDECRTDMFGNCDASEVGYATLQEIKEHRPELLEGGEDAYAALKKWERESCPNCSIKLSKGYVSDATAGGVLVSFKFEYCNECMYIGDSNITNISR